MTTARAHDLDLARDSATTTASLHDLAASTQTEVRLAVAGRPDASTITLSTLAEEDDTDEQVRTTAQATLEDNHRAEFYGDDLDD